MPTCVSCVNKIQYNCDKNMILLFQLNLQDYFLKMFVYFDFIYEKYR